MSNKNLKSIILGLFLLSATMFVSCQKEKETIGVVIVTNIDGEKINKATVTLHQDGQISPQGEPTDPGVKKTKETDANGRAEFVYDLEATLRIEVTKTEGNNTLSNTGVIRLLRGKTVTTKVEIN